MSNTAIQFLSNTPDGSGINLVEGTFIPKGTENSINGQNIPLRRDKSFHVTVINGIDTLNTNGSNQFTINGYWKGRYDWPTYPTPATEDGGSISDDLVFTGIKIIQICVMRNPEISNPAVGEYFINILIEGADIPVDLFRYIDVKGIGKLRPDYAKTFSPIALNSNVSNWSWPITQAQYDSIVASGKIKASFSVEWWSDLSAIICADQVADLGTKYAGFYSLQKVADNGHAYNYQDGQYNNLGTIVNPPEDFHDLITVAVRNAGTLGDTNDLFYIHAYAPNMTASSFGAFIVKGVGAFPATAAVYSPNATFGSTIIDWNLVEFIKEYQPKTGLDFVGNVFEFEIDNRAFVSDRTTTLAVYNSGTYHTKYAQVSYNGWGAGGNMSDRFVGGRELFQIIFVEDTGYGWKAYLTIGVKGASVTEGLFDYFEIEGIGRFYFKDRHDYISAPSDSWQMSWPISIALWNKLNTGQVYNTQFFV